MAHISTSCTARWIFFNASHEILLADQFARLAQMSRNFCSGTKSCQPGRYDEEHYLKKNTNCGGSGGGGGGGSGGSGGGGGDGGGCGVGGGGGGGG